MPSGATRTIAYHERLKRQSDLPQPAPRERPIDHPGPCAGKILTGKTLRPVSKGVTMRTKPCLSLTDVQKILAACEAEAVKNRWNVAIAIVDEGSHLLGFLRMDGAGPISADVAVGKARTSALTKRPSKFFEDRVKDRPAFVSFPAGVLIQGALPIMHQNECVGAIGVSGVQSHEDEQIALAGLNAL
jgi:glc operon protein GlcG